MRNKGSYEAARERLTATARIIADRVSAAIPGQTWKFTEDPAGRKADREGLSCKELTGDIARRPIADAVIFGTAFSAEDFKVVTNIVREEAAKYGATTESSLFNESANAGGPPPVTAAVGNRLFGRSLPFHAWAQAQTAPTLVERGAHCTWGSALIVWQQAKPARTRTLPPSSTNRPTPQ